MDNLQIVVRLYELLYGDVRSKGCIYESLSRHHSPVLKHNQSHTIHPCNCDKSKNIEDDTQRPSLVGNMKQSTRSDMDEEDIVSCVNLIKSDVDEEDINRQDGLFSSDMIFSPFVDRDPERDVYSKIVEGKLRYGYYLSEDNLYNTRSSMIDIFQKQYPDHLAAVIIFHCSWLCRGAVSTDLNSLIWFYMKERLNYNFHVPTVYECIYNPDIQDALGIPIWITKYDPTTFFIHTKGMNSVLSSWTTTLPETTYKRIIYRLFRRGWIGDISPYHLISTLEKIIRSHPRVSHHHAEEIFYIITSIAIPMLNNHCEQRTLLRMEYSRLYTNGYLDKYRYDRNDLLLLLILTAIGLRWDVPGIKRALQRTTHSELIKKFIYEKL